jgi:adenylyltransferase/sulfurtransferase
MDAVRAIARGGWGARFRRDRGRNRPEDWGPRTFRGRGLPPPPPGRPGPFDRHASIGGFSQAALGAAKILLIGAGGLNARVGVDLARKGVGRIVVCDPDVVDPTNLHRTPYLARQVGMPKVFGLGELMVAAALAPLEVLALPASFEGCLRAGVDLACTAAVVGVDGDEARVAAARWAIAADRPLIVHALTANADYAYSLVWTPDRRGGCFGCYDPAAVADPRRPQPCVAGAAVDAVDVAAGLTLYALDSVLMDRPRAWTIFTVALDGDRPSGPRVLPRDPDCPLCAPPAPLPAGGAR